MLVAVTAPTQFQLTSVDDAQAYLGLPTGSPPPNLAGMVAAASRLCAGFVGRPLGAGQWTETFQAPASRFSLSMTPVTGITAFTEAGNAVDPSAYTLNPTAGVVSWCSPQWSDAWCGWPPEVSVTYNAGYLLFDAGGSPSPTVTVPEDIQQACLEVVKMLWFSGGSNVRDPALRSDAVEGVGSSSYLDPDAASRGLPMLAASILATYQRIGL